MRHQLLQHSSKRQSWDRNPVLSHSETSASAPSAPWRRGCAAGTWRRALGPAGPWPWGAWTEHAGAQILYSYQQSHLWSLGPKAHARKFLEANGGKRAREPWTQAQACREAGVDLLGPSICISHGPKDLGSLG